MLASLLDLVPPHAVHALEGALHVRLLQRGPARHATSPLKSSLLSHECYGDDLFHPIFDEPQPTNRPRLEVAARQLTHFRLSRPELQQLHLTGGIRELREKRASPRKDFWTWPWTLKPPCSSNFFDPKGGLELVNMANYDRHHTESPYSLAPLWSSNCLSSMDVRCL